MFGNVRVKIRLRCLTEVLEDAHFYEDAKAFSLALFPQPAP